MGESNDADAAGLRGNHADVAKMMCGGS